MYLLPGICSTLFQACLFTIHELPCFYIWILIVWLLITQIVGNVRISFNVIVWAQLFVWQQTRMNKRIVKIKMNIGVFDSVGITCKYINPCKLYGSLSFWVLSLYGFLGCIWATHAWLTIGPSLRCVKGLEKYGIGCKQACLFRIWVSLRDGMGNDWK